MARLDAMSYWTMLVGVLCLSNSVQTSIAYERSIHLAIAVLFACSFSVSALVKALPNFLQPPESAHKEYTALALDDLDESHDPAQASKPASTKVPEGRVRLSVLLTTITALCIRLDLHRRRTRLSECPSLGLEVFVPFLFAVYDACRYPRTITRERRGRFDLDGRENDSDPAFDWVIIRSRWRYLSPSLMVSLGAFFLLRGWPSLNSSTICPISDGSAKTIMVMEVLSTILDLVILVVMRETSPTARGGGLSARRLAVLWSSTTFATATIWMIIGAILYCFRSWARVWYLLLDLPWLFRFLFATIGQVLLITIVFVTSLHSVSTFGVLEVVVSIAATTVLAFGFEYCWTLRCPYPPASVFLVVCSFLLISAGWATYRLIEASIANRGKRRLTMITFGISTFFLLLPALLKHPNMRYHPIDLLVHDAKIHHEQYISRESRNVTLQEAVTEYQARYHRHPPPGFDVWFQYAQARSSLIIHEYDQIYNDLLPHQTLFPEVIRHRLWEAVSNPHNDISAVSVRDGKAHIQENVDGPHRWMLDGIADMINKFASHLPDMDIAINLNDEPRVILPEPVLSNAIDMAKVREVSGSTGFSPDRQAGWRDYINEHADESDFVMASYVNSFQRYGSIGCKANSPARRYPHIFSQAELRTDYAQSHSLGQFLANWTLAGDICHQPDMAYLHGLYLSPASFLPTTQLFPIFSQSKAKGFSDILYPSPWNYMDKVTYNPREGSGTPGTEDYQPGYPDPSYIEKVSVAFWRGATSEGISTGDQVWHGMSRQRLVHMTNNRTLADHSATLLLRDPDNRKAYKYHSFSGPELRSMKMRTDVAFVTDGIQRCGGDPYDDCVLQKQEFDLNPPVDFQAHWKYRFLFDMDGAGFSGRFLPFLRSNSLPFKAALFREWYDSRVTAWHHFVPLDLRLHGVWSTLAYFMGVQVNIGGKIWEIDAHDREGELIASQGRYWANAVLRKEDMEIYLFRLLLEYGRLTDDNRDELGFVLDPVAQ